MEARNRRITTEERERERKVSRAFPAGHWFMGYSEGIGGEIKSLEKSRKRKKGG